MLKKSISLLLIIFMLFLNFNCAYSADSEAELYSIYSDNMLFKQNEKAIISGTGTPDTKISVELRNKDNVIVAENYSSVNNDGIFEVMFDSPEGSFDTYTVIVKKEGIEFDRLENVVFGELWLASGQSNMQYPLGQAKHGVEMMNNSEKLNKYLRVLITPFFAELNDTVGKIPFEPQKDIPGSKWITGDDLEIYGASAVACFFAEKMIDELDMPVGILNVSLGGSTIASWISRASIESDTQVKNDFINYEKYVEAEKWNTEVRSIYYEMSTNYNLRIEALKNFKLSGMIWYQGETDISWTGEAYSRAFDLLQRSYTELFEYKEGLLPIVFTQLASYYYSEGGFDVPARNVDFSEIQQAHPESRALISIYDVPLTYQPSVGAIHPEHKKEVGERMAFSALGMVYDRYDSYTAATVSNYEIKNNSVYVTLKNVGNNLTVKGNEPKGFSICADDGIYVKANAELIGKDTVRIFAEEVPAPVSAAYAFSVNNEKSNLFASIDGNITLPVSPFVTDRSVGKKYWSEKTWADCDDEIIWHNIGDDYSGYYPAWECKNSEIKFIENGSYLNINSDKKIFSVKPVLQYKDDMVLKSFYDADKDYSTYGKISFKIKNDSKNDITLREIRFYKNDLIWYSPAFENTSAIFACISADSGWQSISFDLNKLYFLGFDAGLSYSNCKLSEINNIEFIFESDNENSDISVDNIRFTPCETRNETGFDADIESAENIFEYVSALFVKFLGTIVSLFK